MRVNAILAGLVVCGTFAAVSTGRSMIASTAEPAHPVVLAGLKWYGSLAEATSVAAKDNKPVLHLQMFGRLDDAFC